MDELMITLRSVLIFFLFFTTKEVINQNQPTIFFLNHQIRQTQYRRWLFQNAIHVFLRLIDAAVLHLILANVTPILVEQYVIFDIFDAVLASLESDLLEKVRA